MLNAMLNAKFLLLYSALAAGAWGVSFGSNQWQVLIQVICAVVVSISIFLAVLTASETEPPADAPEGDEPGLRYRNRFVENAPRIAVPPQG